MKPQVKPSHYFNKKYNTPERLACFDIQARLIIELKPKNVLEIGIGNGKVTEKVRKAGILVTTLDFDKKLKPDIVADAVNLPLKENSFDLVSCFEVLEHLLYKQFKTSLCQIHKVAKKYALLSVPDISRQYPLVIPALKKIIKNIIGRPEKTNAHIFDGQHYWEIGKTDYPLKKILKDIKKSGFLIKKTFRHKNCPNRRFFVLECKKYPWV